MTYDLQPWPNILFFFLSCRLTVRHGRRAGGQDGGWGEVGEGKVALVEEWTKIPTDTEHITVKRLVSAFLFLLKEYGVPFMETSARTGINVELAFLAIAK